MSNPQNVNVNTTVEINGVKYVRADSVSEQISGSRAVIVVDRGWIFAGDVVRKDGRIRLSRAIHVRSWNTIGFDGMISQPKSVNVTLKKISDVDIPGGAEVFCIPVDDNWGL